MQKRAVKLVRYKLRYNKIIQRKVMNLSTRTALVDTLKQHKAINWDNRIGWWKEDRLILNRKYFYEVRLCNNIQDTLVILLTSPHESVTQFGSLLAEVDYRGRSI